MVYESSQVKCFDVFVEEFLQGDILFFIYLILLSMLFFDWKFKE